MMRALVVLLLSAFATTVHAQNPSAAEELDAPPTKDVVPVHDHAVSLHLLTLGTGGLAFQYERIPPGWTLSFVASAGYRAGAGDDYSSGTLAAGGGVRWWPWAGTGEDDRATGGFFVEGRLDLGWTRVTDERDNRVVGHTVSIAETLHVGWRFVLFDRVELTPTLGFGLSHDIDPDGLLAPITGGRLGFALTVGALF